MKKKTVKKLVLARETVRSLSQMELGRVAGGTFITAPSCNCTFQCWSNPEYSCQQDFDPLATSGC
jgi:hypothetical protein